MGSFKLDNVMHKEYMIEYIVNQNLELCHTKISLDARYVEFQCRIELVMFGNGKGRRN